jgi:hypothetical protein
MFLKALARKKVAISVRIPVTKFRESNAFKTNKMIIPIAIEPEEKMLNLKLKNMVRLKKIGIKK